MSIAAIRHLVQDRLELQKYMDDNSNKNAGIWDKIAVTYNARVDSGDLPASDRRTVESLKAQWSTLHGSFKVHCRAMRERLWLQHQTGPSAAESEWQALGLLS